MRARLNEFACRVEQEQECAKDVSWVAWAERVGQPFAWASSETAQANMLAW